MTVGVPWILLANGSNRLLTVGTQLVVGFLLMPEQLGSFAVAAGVAGMVTPFQSTDHARLALQDGPSRRATAAVLRNWLLLGSLSSCMLAIVVIPLTGLAVSVAPLACVVVLSLLRVISNARLSLMSYDGRSTAIACVSMVDGASRSLTLVGTALLGAGMWSLVFGEVASALATAVLLARLEPGPATGGFQLPPPLQRKLITTLGVCLLVGVELNCSAVAIGHLCSAASVGSFSFANRIACQLAVLILPLIALESIPRLLAARDSESDFIDASRRERRRLLMLIIPLGLAIILVGPPVMIMVWAERWREASCMLPWLGVSIGLRIAYALAKAHLEALGCFSWIFRLSVLDTFLILAIVIAAGSMSGAMLVVGSLACESAVILTAAVLVVRSQLLQRRALHNQEKS